MPAQPDAHRVVILNQYYAPDVASTGILIAELAQHLASKHVKVGVVTTMPSYGPPETWQNAPRRETANGVSVLRMRTTRFSKDNLLGRLLNSITFLAPLFLRMLFRRNRPEVFLYTSNPPYLGVIGACISLLRRHAYVILLHDSYPQLAVWVGKIRGGGLIDRLWHVANRLMYQRARETIVLCPAAKSLVCNTYGIAQERVHVIPNWSDGALLRPIDKSQSTFAAQHDLVEPFTALYSGNLGLYYDFDTMLDAAELLREDPFRLVLVGGGGRRDHVAKQVRTRGLDNAMVLPYQPLETLNDSLNACDASFVTIAKGIEGISFPSKLYASLAVGRPILAISEARSDLRDLVEDRDVGMWVELGNAEGLAGAILRLIADPEAAAAMGKRARALFEERYTIAACADRYNEVLLAARSAG